MMRVGLIGVGAWGSRLLTRLMNQPEFSVIAALDPAPSVSALSVPIHERAEEFWSSAFDAVVVAGPPSIQGALGIDVLRRGYPLFIEKPMALSQDVAEEIVELSRQKRLIVHVDHLVRYDALHVRALKLVASGALGQVFGSVHVRLGARSRPGLFAHSVLLPHDLSLIHAAYGDQGRWEATSAESGILARRSRPQAEKVLLWSGPEGPPRRQTLYLGSQGVVLVNEGMRLSVLPAPDPGLLRLFDGPLVEETIHSFFGELAQKPPLEEFVAEGDALSASLSAFARAVRTGRPSVCDATDGACVTRALLTVNALLERN